MAVAEAGWPDSEFPGVHVFDEFDHANHENLRVVPHAEVGSLEQRFNLRNGFNLLS
jgi:hypothetical protein